VVTIPPQEVDALGLHVWQRGGACAARWRGCAAVPGYVLTDGFPVRRAGHARPGGVESGDQVTAVRSAAPQVVAKVTRDRMMVALDGPIPPTASPGTRGIRTPEHMTALMCLGPVRRKHRYSGTPNVLQANRRWATGWQGEAADLEAVPSAD